MKFSYYNLSSRILLVLCCLVPFLGISAFFITVGNGLALALGMVMLFLFGVFTYKCFFIQVYLDEKGVTYKSLLKEQHFAWEDIQDVLIAVRERRSTSDYYRYDEWMDAGKMGKSYFILFRTTSGFPDNPMFMFSAPTGEDYISVQFRPSIKKALALYK